MPAPACGFGMAVGLALSCLAGGALHARTCREGAVTSGTVPRATAEVLLCPGPVMLSPGVKAALAQCEIGHRDARFSELVARLRRNCGLVLGANEGHSVVFITGPATAGIEAACASLFPPDASVIVPVNGTFGARIVDILKVHGVPCIPIDFGFGQPFDLARIEAAMTERRRAGFPAALAMTHHETSAGLINPVAEVCALARRHGLRTLVDATCSAGAEDLDVTRDGIDVCITSSGKCLHAPPGVALVCVRRDMLSARVGASPRSYSLDFVASPRPARGEFADPVHACGSAVRGAGPGRRGTAGTGSREAPPLVPASPRISRRGSAPPRAAATPSAGGQRGLLDTHGRGSAAAWLRRSVSGDARAGLRHLRGEAAAGAALFPARRHGRAVRSRPVRFPRGTRVVPLRPAGRCRAATA